MKAWEVTARWGDTGEDYEEWFWAESAEEAGKACLKYMAELYDEDARPEDYDNNEIIDVVPMELAIVRDEGRVENMKVFLAAGPAEQNVS